MSFDFDTGQKAAVAGIFAAPDDTDLSGSSIEGHVDFFGYHPVANGLFVGGWITHPWPVGSRPKDAVAHFDNLTVNRHRHSMFYYRDDVIGRGIGFVFFFDLQQAPVGPLISLQVSCAGYTRVVDPTPDVVTLKEHELGMHLQDLLSGGEDGSECQKLRALLFGDLVRLDVTGFVDFYGYHEAAGGWLFSGWITAGWHEEDPPKQFVISFEQADIEADGFAVLFQRNDLQDNAVGVAFFVRGEGKRHGQLCSVSFAANGLRATLHLASITQKFREPEIVNRMRPVLLQSALNSQRDILLALLSRQPYRGEDTLAALSSVIHLEIDEAIVSQSGSLMLLGWCLMRPGEIRDIRIRCGLRVTSLNLETSIRVARPDVIEGFASQGFEDPRCGFVSYLSSIVEPRKPLYLEVETVDHVVGYRVIPRPRLEGIASIKRLLASVDVRFRDVKAAFENVLGPAIEELNCDRLSASPQTTTMEYGELPQAPRWSVIVPLYGRLDFVEYQMALFSEQPHCKDAEFIYVLDDPPKRREAEFLFVSVYERFQIPFKAVLMDRNVGYAPANNIGLVHARGNFIVFLNSDVFPGTSDWLERLSARIVEDPSIGVIGPVLLFEDGAVQHRGMYFSQLPEFGNWFFGVHHDKGLRLASDGQVESHLSITGACMMMTRALANEVGGFDEIYVLGDFEDSDLCLKIQELGYQCLVDPNVQLFHLERKSQAQADVGWRMNLTVYNAWQHERRWGATIAARQGL